MYVPNIEQTAVFGGNGGNAYVAANTIEFNPNMRLMKIKMRSGDMIDSIQFIFSDGMNQYELAKMGGNGGRPGEWVVPQGEEVTKIIVRHSKYLCGLQFETNTGKQSQIFGRSTGTKTEVQIPGHLLAYGGRSGALIDAIQFYYWN